jgi:hypothetical protein
MAMHRFIRRGGLAAAQALLITAGAGAAVALPAQAASTWSATVSTPAAVGSQQFAENAAGAQVAIWSTLNESTFLTSVFVSTSANGQTWSTPVTLATGEDASPDPVATIAPNGRIVVAWVGGPDTALVVQSSVLPSGGTWSTPVNVSTDIFGGPVIGMDGSGNTILTWLGASRQIRTASLHASTTTWTAVNTLDTALDGFALNMAVSANGSAVITWIEAPHSVYADSGTVLGGFAAPITIDSQATLATRGIGRSGPGPLVYFSGHTQVVQGNSGVAVLQWSAPESTATAIRSAAGTWSVQTASSGSYAVDGAGDILNVTTQTSSGVTSVYTSRRPAGSSTWTAPSLLAAGSSPLVAGDAAGTFVVALQTASGPNAFTSPPGGIFGTAATFPATDTATALMIDSGRAALLLAPAADSTEPVS